MNENVLLDAKMKLDELARGFQSSTILLTACKESMGTEVATKV